MIGTASELAWLTALATGAVAYAGTNLDNIAILCALATGARGAAGRSAAALLLAAAFLGLLALAGAEIADELPVSFLRWLGIIPLSLGSFALWSQVRSPGESALSRRASASMVSLVAVVLSNSGDTLAVFIPLLAESGVNTRVAFLTGAAMAALLAAVLLRTVLSNPALLGLLSRLGPWFAPVAMILAGLYVMLDTPTDLA